MIDYTKLDQSWFGPQLGQQKKKKIFPGGGYDMVSGQGFPTVSGVGLDMANPSVTGGGSNMLGGSGYTTPTVNMDALRQWGIGGPFKQEDPNTIKYTSQAAQTRPPTQAEIAAAQKNSPNPWALAVGGSSSGGVAGRPKTWGSDMAGATGAGLTGLDPNTSELGKLPKDITGPPYTPSDPGNWWDWSPDQGFNQQYGSRGSVYNIANDKWKTSGDPGSPNVNQNWWFNEDWGQLNGEDAVYNKYWGFQPFGQVRDLYRGATGPVSNEDFEKWGLQSGGYNFPGWWGGGTGGDDLTPLDENEWNGGYDDETVKKYTEGYDSGQGYRDTLSAIQLPQEWEQARSVLGDVMGGGFTRDDPAAWGTAINAATDLAGTGGRADLDPWYQSAKGVAQTDIQDSIKEAAEQAGLGGMRWSSPLGRSAQDIAGRRMESFASDYLGKELAANEAAQNRRLSASSLLGTLGGQQAGLQNEDIQNILGATGMAGTQGSNITNYITGLAGQANEMGTQVQNQENEYLKSLYSDYMRSMAPENNPYLQLAGGYAGTPGVPQTYGQSGWGSLLGGLGSLGGGLLGSCL